MSPRTTGGVLETALLDGSVDSRPDNSRCVDRVVPQGSLATGVVVGTLTGLSETGRPLLRFTDGAGLIVCAAGRTIVDLTMSDVGRDVALQCERGDPERPIVLGLLRDGQATDPRRQRGIRDLTGPVVEVDGETIRIAARQELVLRCGDASITLTRAGKVVIRGTYLLSRSNGVNRIKGGSVEIN